jgi:hypothetical protein
MTRILLALLLVAAPLVATAQSTSCYTSSSGRWTDCDNGQSFWHSSSGRWSDDNRGNTYWHSRDGRTTTDNHGNTWEHRGRNTYGPNGITCRQSRSGRWTDCQ